MRHGENKSNAGYATHNTASVTLTVLDHKQVQKLMYDIEGQPDLFIMPPYLRTQKTAKRILEKFPNVPCTFL
ncbi:hypothetical protein [Pedobacter sp. V48]|uniref:hypothetical protein n=1 Tax=Pedobacter sp. V48 TaxID=509635 RepID=UPI00358FFEF4